MSVQTLNINDKIKPQIGISDEAKEAIAKALSIHLASSYTLYLKTLYYHWNVTGTNFKGLHDLFEEQYQNLQAAGDDIAERIRALGSMTPGTIKEYIELTEIPDDDKLPENSQKMVKNLLEGNETAAKNAREVFKLAEEHGDQVSADMMVERMNHYDKSAWMLRSSLENNT